MTVVVHVEVAGYATEVNEDTVPCQLSLEVEGPLCEVFPRIWSLAKEQLPQGQRSLMACVRLVRVGNQAFDMAIMQPAHLN